MLRETRKNKLIKQLKSDVASLYTRLHNGSCNTKKIIECVVRGSHTNKSYLCMPRAWNLCNISNKQQKLNEQSA